MVVGGVVTSQSISGRVFGLVTFPHLGPGPLCLFSSLYDSSRAFGVRELPASILFKMARKIRGNARQLVLCSRSSQPRGDGESGLSVKSWVAIQHCFRHPIRRTLRGGFSQQNHGHRRYLFQ